MATPAHIAAAIGAMPVATGRRLARDDACEGAKFHSPSPLILHEVDLVPWDPTVTETAWLCGICADNLSIIQHLLGESEGRVAWEIRREFGNQVRALGLKGWDIYAGRVKGSG